MIDCYQTLGDHPVFFVGVHCSEDELVRRELQRGDRIVGQAKKQLQFVHQQSEEYEIEVDTSSEQLEHIASTIVNRLEYTKHPIAWETSISNFKR